MYIFTKLLQWRNSGKAWLCDKIHNVIYIKDQNIHSICEEAIDTLSKAGLKPEYFRICDGKTLKQIESPQNHPNIVACVAAWAEDVRLIDNMVLKVSKK